MPSPGFIFKNVQQKAINSAQGIVGGKSKDRASKLAYASGSQRIRWRAHARYQTSTPLDEPLSLGEGFDFGSGRRAIIEASKRSREISF